MPLILDGEGRGLNTRHEGCARRWSLEAVPCTRVLIWVLFLEILDCEGNHLRERRTVTVPAHFGPGEQWATGQHLHVDPPVGRLECPGYDGPGQSLANLPSIV